MYRISNTLDDFIKLPQLIYENDPFYVVKQENIPSSAALFSVLKDEEIISRACVIYNPELSYKNKKTVQIGFFESKDDINAAAFLIENIKIYCQKEGFEYLIGPINGSTWQKYRITLPSQNPPFFLDNYNKPYYQKLFEQTGFSTISRYTSTVYHNLNSDFSRLERFETIFDKKNIMIRNFDVSNFEKELTKIYEISVKSFKDNFLYTPISFEDFISMYSAIKSLINPEWVLIAEDKEENPLGFIFGVDNIFDKNKKSLVLKTLAKVPLSSIKGLGTYLTEKLHQKAFEKGYDEIIHALMYEENVSANIMGSDSELLHEYLLYGVEL